MRILGVDPGVAIVGYGVIKKNKNITNGLGFIAAGCILTAAGTAQAQRLNTIRVELSALIKKYKPDLLAVEELFFCKNVKTALQVGEARGVILATAMQYGLPIHEFTPLQVKQALTGYGRADKNQVQQMVKIILHEKSIIRPDDAADAVAVAITCAHNKNHES